MPVCHSHNVCEIGHTTFPAIPGPPGPVAGKVGDRQHPAYEMGCL
jgi:hypothetical protein